MDSLWLFNNTPWSNHDGMNSKLVFESPIEAYAIKMKYDGDINSLELINFTFDNIIVTAFHGFGGNSYSFVFKLGDRVKHNTDSLSKIGYSANEVKEKFIENRNDRIKGLNHQIEIQMMIINKVLELK